MPALVRTAEKAIEDGKCVVIGLQSTGGARTQDVVAERGEELDDFVSGPRVNFSNRSFLEHVLNANCMSSPGT